MVKNPCCRGPRCLYILRYTSLYVIDPLSLWHLSQIVFFFLHIYEKAEAWSMVFNLTDRCHPTRLSALYRASMSTLQILQRNQRNCDFSRRLRLALTFALITVSRMSRVSRMSKVSRMSIALIEQGDLTFDNRYHG